MSDPETFRHQSISENKLEEIKTNLNKTQRAIDWVVAGYELVGLLCPISKVVLQTFFGVYSVALNEMDQKLTENLDTLKSCRTTITNTSYNTVRISIYYKSYRCPQTGNWYELPYEIDPLGYY